MPRRARGEEEWGFDATALAWSRGFDGGDRGRPSGSGGFMIFFFLFCSKGEGRGRLGFS
jgi:hypothetical protein